jgi:hypothetical protein
MLAPTRYQFKALLDGLNQMTAEGNFTVAVLTDENGLPLAFSGASEDASEDQSAAVAQIQKMILRVLDHMSMAQPDEFALNDVNGTRLVCRSFQAAGSRLILAVQIPNRNQSYRKLMNGVIRSIQKDWVE